MQEAAESLFNIADFVPELRRQFEGRPFDPKRPPRVALQIKRPKEGAAPIPACKERHVIVISSGEESWFWEAKSLRGLFRGSRQPPVLGDYPQAYNDSFILLELHVLEFCQGFGPPRDAELKDIYSALRRRPDGKSLGALHDYLWQAAAFVLGTRPLSQAEFEAIAARLERSCRTFELGPSSRNYAASIQSALG